MASSTDRKHWALPLLQSKPRQGGEDSSANLFCRHSTPDPQKDQQHQRFDHIGTVQIEIAEKVSEALARHLTRRSRFFVADTISFAH